DGLLVAVLAEEEDGRSVTYSYGGPFDDQLTTVTDVRGNDWTYRYNIRGLVDQVTDPTGRHLETIDYVTAAIPEDGGRVASITNGAQETTSYVWEESSSRVITTDPSG